MPTADPWVLEWRDRYGTIQGTCDTYSQLSATLNHLGVDVWTLACRVNEPIVAELLQPGAGIQLRKRHATVPVTSGYVTNASIKAGVATFSGVGDMIVLADRQASPQPLTATTPYSLQEFDARSGLAELIIKTYVYYNAEAGAVPARRWPGFSIAPDLGRGSHVVGSGRWTSLFDLCKQLAISGGLGMRCVGLTFDVYEPVVRDGFVFSIESGTLDDVQFSQSVPQATYVYIGGTGTGAGRTIVEGWANGALAAGWWRRERFVDAGNESVTAVLVQKGLEALGLADTDPSKIGLTLDISPNTHLEFGVDYNVGDYVTVVTPWGPEWERRIEQVVITVDQNGSRIVPTLGPLGQEITDTAAAAAVALGRRLSYLERR